MCNGPSKCVLLYEGVRLEGVSSANVLQFLRDLGWRPVQFFCHTFLLVRVHAVKLLTQISVNHILERRTEKTCWFPVCQWCRNASAVGMGIVRVPILLIDTDT